MHDLATKVWPDSQAWEKLDTAQIAVTRFADFRDYHDALRDAVLAVLAVSAPADPTYRVTPASCGRKARDVAAWDLPPGTMVMFAGQYVHGVHAYRGHRPRLTMSWNITLAARPGGARDWARELAQDA